MQEKGLKKSMGVFTLTALGIGAIIGSGIFIMPAAMAAVAGPGLILGIMIAGLISLILGLSYAELGSAFPVAGGPYALPRMAMGNLGGFILGWGYFLYLFIGTAAIIDIFVVYLNFYVPGLAVGSTLTPLGISVAVIALWIFTLINIIGVKWGALYSVVTTIGKLIPLAIFFIAGLFYMKTGNFTPFLPFGLSGVTIAVTLFFWSFTGFESIVIPTEEVKKPGRTIPLAMIMTLVTTTVIYILIAYVFIGMIDWSSLGFGFKSWSSVDSLSSPLADIAQSRGIIWLAVIAIIGAIISTAGAGGSWVLIQGRFPYAMAKDGLFWSYMKTIHPKYRTPVPSLIFTSILTTIVMIAIPNFPSVALVASVTGAVVYAAAAVSVPILRKTYPDTKRPFKLPMMHVVTLLGFILSTYVFYWGTWPWTFVY